VKEQEGEKQRHGRQQQGGGNQQDGEDGKHQRKCGSIEHMQTQRQRTGFTDLPLEVREQIYGYVISAIRASTLNTLSQWRPLIRDPKRIRLTYLKDLLPVSLYLDHEIMREASIVFLRRTTLHIPDAYAPVPSVRMLDKVLEPMHIFLGRFPDDRGYASMRHLELTLRDGQILTGIELSEKTPCRGLHQLFSMFLCLVDGEVLLRYSLLSGSEKKPEHYTWTDAMHAPFKDALVKEGEKRGMRVRVFYKEFGDLSRALDVHISIMKLVYVRRTTRNLG
jgi:hypothetical protein